MPPSPSLDGSSAPGAFRVAVFAKGFRPFFLGAALYAVLAVPLFLLVLEGRVAPGSYLAPNDWHGHEMVFGFTAAVFAGFLLTAASNWTASVTAEGPLLALLVLLWALGRAGMLLADQLPAPIAAVIDVVFLPALAIACARPIVAKRSQRNYGFIALLGALALANAAVHGSALGIAPAHYAMRANLIAIDLITVALVVMSGRIVPMFTKNATRVEIVRAVPALERIAAASAMVVVVLEIAGLPAELAAAARGVAGVFALLRMRTWGTVHTRREPLLWILHAGSLWLVIGLWLRAIGGFYPIVAPAGLHAITAGAIGSLALGMMTRVGLGHTGRTLAVPPHMALAFGVIILAGAVRVAAPLLWPGMLGPLVLAGVLWSAAFAVYLVTYAAVLVTPRADGRPG